VTNRSVLQFGFQDAANALGLDDVSVALVANGPIATVSGGGSFCSGSDGSANIQAALTGVQPWTVTWSDGFVQSVATNILATRSVSPSVTTTYTVTALADANGPVAAGNLTGSATVTVNPLPTVSVNSPTINAGDSATLTATTSASNPGYLWSDNETAASITVSPSSTTTYTVMVTDGTTGCANSGSGTVTVTPSVPSSTVTIASFDDDAGFSGAYPSFGAAYGSSTVSWDGAHGNPAGAIKITCQWSSGSDTPCADYICYPGDNWYYNGSVNWPLSQYRSIDFDIMWDSADSDPDFTIDCFNNFTNWPAGWYPSWAGSQPISLFNDSVIGLEIDVTTGSGVGPYLWTTNIPVGAATSWQHVSIPINPAETGIDGACGIVLHKWIANNWGIVGTHTAYFWIDNLVFVGPASQPPPPTLLAPTTKATPGLNVFSSTEGNGFYDRQAVELRQSSGLTWVGHATTDNPVTYSFTIAGYPNSVNCEAYLFLVPNPAANDSGPDWNETNCAIAYLQGNSSQATMHFQYKVNEGLDQSMYSGGGIDTHGRGPYANAPGSWDGVRANYLESGNLGSVTNPGVLGTWTVKFTSDTNVTLIAPNGNTSTCVIPPYNIGYFAENSGFNVYLGMQANQADGMNQAVVYSNFTITGVASPYSENFLADSVLDTTNTWNTSVAGGPKGVLVVPTTGAYWLQWTLPDSGFSLEVSPTLTDALAWTSPSSGPIIPLYGLRSQLVVSNEMPVGNTTFFRLIQSVSTQ